VDQARPELLVQNPLQITNYEQNIVINFHPDFAASNHRATSCKDRQIGAYSIGLTMPRTQLSKPEEEDPTNDES
jgi:hypothetical protein